MLEKTKLEVISSELPEAERRELLARIHRSMDREGRGEYRRIELKQEERERLLAEEIQNLTFWTRLVLWLRRLFSGKSRRDLFVDLKLKQIKRSIRHRSSGLTGFETRDLSSKFARYLYDLYYASYPLRGLIQAFHADQGFRSRAVIHLFDHSLPQAKRSVEDFLPTDEMERVYHDTGNVEEVQKRLLHSYSDYVKQVPGRLVRQTEEGIKPLVYLRNLVLFPYARLFHHFNYQPSAGIPEDKYPLFTNAPAMLMLEQLERLWHAASLAAELGSDWFCHEELLSFYLDEELRAGEEEGEIVDLDHEEELAELSGALGKLVESARDFLKRVPLLELLRYFRKDPYYRLVFAGPRFRAKPVFVSALRERILDQLENRIVQIQKRVIDARIREIFKSNKLYEMFYYVETPSFDYTALEMPYFSYTKSLKILYNYLSKIYKGHIQETLQIVNTYMVSGNRIFQTRLNQHASGLEELEAKIVLFDRSFAPDEDDGKILLRLRHRLATDLNQQRQFRSFVLQKDKEARALINQAMEYLAGIQQVYEDLLASPTESIKSALKTLHFYKGKNQTLAGILNRVLELISNFQELIVQLVVLEKGS